VGGDIFPTSFYVFALFEYTVLTALEILSSGLVWMMMVK